LHFTLADLVTDITQNGAESGASLVELEISETQGPNGNPGAGGKAEFRFVVRDNGKGMSPEGLKRAMDPFVTDGIKHPYRKVGLGIPFLIQTAEQSGGGWDIKSQKAVVVEGPAAGPQAATVPAGAGLDVPVAVPSGEASHGTMVTAWFDAGNVDTPPVGDISGMFRTIILFEGPQEVHITRTRKGGAGDLAYEVRKSELIEALGDLEETQSLILLDQYLRSLESIETEE
jgi:hypothetical protein